MGPLRLIFTVAGELRSPLWLMFTAAGELRSPLRLSPPIKERSPPLNFSQSVARFFFTRRAAKFLLLRPRPRRSRSDFTLPLSSSTGVRSDFALPLGVAVHRPPSAVHRPPPRFVKVRDPSSPSLVDPHLQGTTIVLPLSIRVGLGLD